MNPPSIEHPTDRHGRRRLSGKQGICLLLIATVVLHLSSLFLPFFIDDYVYLESVKGQSIGELARFFNTGTMDETASGVWWTPKGVLPFYRPVVILSFALDFAVWGLNAFGFHLTNLALHVLCTYLVWRLAGVFWTKEPWRLVAAGVFAFHPAHTEALLWVSGRFDLMVCATMLLAVPLWMRWMRTGGWVFLLGGVACFLVGLGCKETALVLPAILVVWLLLTEGWTGIRARAVRFGWTAGVLGVVSLGYVAHRFSMFGGLGKLPPPYGIDFSAPGALGEVLRNAGQYLLDFVLWIQIDALYLDAFWEHHRGWLALVSVVALGLVWAGWRVSIQRPAYLAGLVWTVLFMIPSLMAMPGERNMYLPNVGLAIMSCAAAAGIRARLESAGVAIRIRWARRAGWAVCLLGVGIVLFEHVVAWRIGDATQGVYTDLKKLEPDPPPGARFYVVHQAPLTAVGFSQGVRLHYNREDLSAVALSLAPYLDRRGQDTAYRESDRTIRIERRGNYFFDSFIERFLLFSCPAEGVASCAKRFNLKLLTDLESLDGLDELRIELPLPIDDPRTILLTWKNEHVRTLSDVMWFAERPSMVRCRLRSPGDAVARTN